MLNDILELSLYSPPPLFLYSSKNISELNSLFTLSYKEVFTFPVCRHTQVIVWHSGTGKGFCWSKNFLCVVRLFTCSDLWEMKGSGFSWLYVFLLSVHETVAMAFHHPKQVKTCRPWSWGLRQWCPLPCPAVPAAEEAEKGMDVWTLLVPALKAPFPSFCPGPCLISVHCPVTKLVALMGFVGISPARWGKAGEKVPALGDRSCTFASSASAVALCAPGSFKIDYFW